MVKYDAIFRTQHNSMGFKQCIFQILLVISSDLSRKQMFFNGLIIHYLILITVISYGNMLNIVKSVS